LHTALSVCHIGVRKWLEKSAEKQKHKLRKTLNPLSRKAFKAASFSATKDKIRQNLVILADFLNFSGPVYLKKPKMGKGLMCGRTGA